jgi:glutaredoxin 3
VASVEIYSKGFCSYCVRAKRLFESKGIAFTEHAIDMQPGKRQEMIERANGRTTVPQIFIDGRHVGGCSDLLALDRDGKLDALVGA